VALPELDVARVQRWWGVGVPRHARRQVRVECEVATRHHTIVERRAPWREDFGPEWTSSRIARLRYTAVDKSWTLYWRDRNLCYHIYELLAPSHRVEDLLTEIDCDPTYTFSGNPREGPKPTALATTQVGANYRRHRGAGLG
jgi:hypothetical protein